MTVEGYAKVLATMNLEHLLRELNAPRMGHVAREFRDPGAYYLTFFDQPQPDALWGWRLLGHHISLNFTVHDQERISATPMMIGAQPARVGVFRPLAEEEDLAFALLRSLSDEQRGRTVIHHLSPADFVTQTVPRIGDEERPARHGVARRDIIVHPEDAEALRYIKAHPRGVAFGELDEGQRARFTELLESYVARVHPSMLGQEMDRIASRRHGRPALRLGRRDRVLAGPLLPPAGTGHGHRVQQHRGRRQPRPQRVARPDERLRPRPAHGAPR